MSAHTPGPWFFDEQDYVSSSYYIRGSKENGRPRSMWTGAVAHIPRSKVMPMRANARLIAAAPDLLEALTEALRAFSHDDEGPVWADSTIAKARAAIAKATGASK